MWPSSRAQCLPKHAPSRTTQRVSWTLINLFLNSAREKLFKRPSLWNMLMSHWKIKHESFKLRDAGVCDFYALSIRKTWLTRSMWVYTLGMLWRRILLSSNPIIFALGNSTRCVRRGRETNTACRISRPMKTKTCCATYFYTMTLLTTRWFLLLNEIYQRATLLDTSCGFLVACRNIVFYAQLHDSRYWSFCCFFRCLYSLFALIK